MRRVFLSCSLLVAALASAQTVDSTRVNLGETQIITNRATAKTPIAFTNVGREELNKYNKGQDIPFLLSTLPSVLTTSDAGAGIGYTSVRIRGTVGERINVSSNGVPMNDAESHGLFWVNIGDFASSLQNIQVQRGVGTSANGAAAFGASINMQTETPSLRPHLSYDGAWGSFSTAKNTFRFGSGLLANNWAFDGRVSFLRTDGYRDRAAAQLGSYFAQATKYSSASVFKLIAFGGKERTYHAWYEISRDDLKHRRKYNPAGEIAPGQYYGDQTDNYFQQHVQALLTHQFNKQLSFSGALHYTYGKGYYEEYKHNRKLKNFGIAPSIDTLTGAVVAKSDLVRQKHLENHFAGAVGTLTYKNERLEWTSGFGANYYAGDHFGFVKWVKAPQVKFSSSARYYSSMGKKWDANVYTRLNYSLTSAFNVFADLQYRHINYTIDGTTDKGVPIVYANAKGEFDVKDQFHFFNPKLGFTWDFVQNHQLYASFSVAHREPVRNNYTESVNLVGTNFVKPRAERLHDYEVGYRYTTPRFDLGLNGYYMNYKDQFVPNGGANEIGEPIHENVAKSYRLGLELSAAWKPCDAFRWEANATLSHNRIQAYKAYLFTEDYSHSVLHNFGNTPIAWSPDFTANNIFSYNYKGFAASLVTQYVGRQYADNFGLKENSIDPYCISHLHLGYTWVTNAQKGQKVTIGASIYNLLNKQYEAYAYSGAGLNNYNATANTYEVVSNYYGAFPMAGTNFLINFGFRF